MAYALSGSGSDWHEWQVREVATGQDLPDLVQWSKFSGAAWLKDGSGFYYAASTRRRPATSGPASTRTRRSSSTSSARRRTADDAGLRAPRPPDWGFSAEVTDDGRYLLVYQSEGTEHEEPHLRPGPVDARRDASQPFLDALRRRRTQVVGNDGDDVLRAHRQRRAAQPAGRDRRSARPQPAAWKTLIAEGPEPRRARRGVDARRSRFVATWQIDAQHTLRVYGLDGTLRARDRAADARLGRLLGEAPRHAKASTRSRRSPTRRRSIRYDPATGAQRAVPPAEGRLHARRTSRRRRSSTRRRTAPTSRCSSRGRRARAKTGKAPTYPLRLRRLQHLADAGVLASASSPGSSMGGVYAVREPARRRRVRQGVARRRPPGSTSRTSSTTSSPRPST